MITWLLTVSTHEILKKRKKERSFIARFNPDQKEKEIDERLERQKEVLSRLYTSFIILEERIEGNLQALEGIRLVRERKGCNPKKWHKSA